MAAPELIGTSDAVKTLREKLIAAAASDAIVLLAGPVGSGRELAARFLHNVSPRRGGPFVPVACPALTGSLADSELFGHEKGAFTGAVTSRMGLIERASGGTLFFSEIGELPPAMQAKVLRFIEDGTITPLGGEPRRVDARVVASTSRDLAGLVRAGSFREDLYYRLRVLKIDVPALAERGEDVLLLAEHFLDVLSQELSRPRPALGEDARRTLMAYPWPGNVQELINVLRSALVFGDGKTISAGDLGLGGKGPPAAHPQGKLKAAVAKAVRELETTMIRQALACAQGNRTRAAKDLGITRRALQLKIRRYGIE